MYSQKDDTLGSPQSQNTNLDVQREGQQPNPDPTDAFDAASTESIDSDRDSALGRSTRSFTYLQPLSQTNMAKEVQQPAYNPFRSSLTSLRPSIYDHVEEGGRKYHAYKAGSSYYLGLDPCGDR
jgi:hypothetical protein